MIRQIEKMDIEELVECIFGIKDFHDFEKVSLSVFNYQYHNCPVYKKFCDILHRIPGNIQNLEDIPFIPADFFRNHKLICGSGKPELCFHSSTTTSAVASKHYIKYSGIYNKSITRCFRLFYGDPSGYCILALLPGYVERVNSSLVYMIDRLMQSSSHKDNGFYLHNHKALKERLESLITRGEKILLTGVSYALLDFAGKYPLQLKNTVVMETGGMKGMRKEMVREELHDKLLCAFGVDEIHSEYGMTELLSQAYALNNGKFKTPPWMKVVFRDINDPFSDVVPGRTGVINVIDLANVFSCSFLATHDLGKQNPDQTFEVLGRMDHSEMRGCNLMVV